MAPPRISRVLQGCAHCALFRAHFRLPRAHVQTPTMTALVFPVDIVHFWGAPPGLCMKVKARWVGCIPSWVSLLASSLAALRLPIELRQAALHAGHWGGGENRSASLPSCHFPAHCPYPVRPVPPGGTVSPESLWPEAVCCPDSGPGNSLHSTTTTTTSPPWPGFRCSSWGHPTAVRDVWTLAGSVVRPPTVWSPGCYR